MTPLKTETVRKFFPHLLIAMVTGIVWAHTISFEFVWDDKYFIERLQSIRSLQHIPQMFYRLDAQSSYPEGFVLFRPLRTVQYALLYQLGGGEPPKPWLFHLTNVLWHGGAALLLYSVAVILFVSRATHDEERKKARLLALLTALAFAVNPVVSEVVCWAKSLDDLMATVFTLAALRSLLRWPSDKRAYIWALVYFLLAVYSKISAVPFALFAFFVFFYFHRAPFMRAIRCTFPFLALAVVFTLHHNLVIGRASQTAPISGSYAQTLIDMLPVVPKYIRLLFGVPPFYIDYSFMKGGNAVTSPPALAGLVLLGALTGFALWGLRKPRFCLMSLGLIWVGLFLLPVSNLMPMMQYMAERFLYLPLVGWLIALGAGLWFVHRWRFTSVLYSIVILVWMGVSWDRALLWRDEITLFVHSSQAGPKVRRVEENAVAAIFDLPQMQKVFRRDPGATNQFVLANNPANDLEIWRAATNTLLKAHQLFPEDENVLNALGIACAKTGDRERAVHFFKLLAERYPQKASYWANLGQACFESRRLEEARQGAEKALNLEPKNVPALRILAAVLWQQNDFGSALKIFEKLQAVEPNNPENKIWIEKAKEKLK